MCKASSLRFIFSMSMFLEEEKDAGTKTYEAMAKRGVPEYSIFLRPMNGSEEGKQDWIWCLTSSSR